MAINMFKTRPMLIQLTAAIGQHVSYINPLAYSRGKYVKAYSIYEYKLLLLGLFSIFPTIIMLYIISENLTFLYTALAIGLFSSSLDFLVEYRGVKQGLWRYPKSIFTLANVPVELPWIFFALGTVLTFVFYSSYNPLFVSFFDPAIFGFSPAQYILLFTGLLFLGLYVRNKITTITYGLLPIAIALYMLYPMPWVLFFAILPIYLDYYIEKRMTRTRDIVYKDYNDEVAFNISHAYFVVTIILFITAFIVYNVWGTV